MNTKKSNICNTMEHWHAVHCTVNVYTYKEYPADVSYKNPEFKR